MTRRTDLVLVYRTTDGQWHFRCAQCTRMNGFDTWRAAFDSARWHITSGHLVTLPARSLDKLRVTA